MSIDDPLSGGDQPSVPGGTVSAGIGIAGRDVDSWRRTGTPLFVVDVGVPAEALVGIVRPSDSVLPLGSTGSDVATVRRIAERIVRERPSLVVAVGGGTTMDAAKLAALAGEPGLLDHALARAERYGVSVLPAETAASHGGGRPRVVAVPTTIGTSSESNAVAIVTTAGGHRLVMGSMLRPLTAILDGALLASLPRALVAEACAEILLRVAGVSTSPRRASAARADAVAIGRSLALIDPRDLDATRTRLRLARTSAATQRSAALRGRDPYAVTHWYLANEASFHLGMRKMPATVAVVPAVWERIVSGHPAWGDRASLWDYWRAITAGSGLPRDPAEGIRALFDAWGLERPERPDDDALDTIARRSVEIWGGRFPALRGLGVDDVRTVLGAGRWTRGSRAQQRTDLQSFRGPTRLETPDHARRSGARTPHPGEEVNTRDPDT